MNALAIPGLVGLLLCCGTTTGNSDVYDECRGDLIRENGGYRLDSIRPKHDPWCGDAWLGNNQNEQMVLRVCKIGDRCCIGGLIETHGSVGLTKWTKIIAVDKEEEQPLLGNPEESQAARAENTVPSRLVIGYEDEGKVDPRPQACLVYAQETAPGWDKTAIKQGAKDVCAARKRHADAYAVLQTNYKIFIKAFSEDRRLDLPEAVSNLRTLINACMDHKFGLTTGGHNIMIDIIENDIRADCVSLGGNLIKDETKQYNALQQLGHNPGLSRSQGLRDRP